MKYPICIVIFMSLVLISPQLLANNLFLEPYVGLAKQEIHIDDQAVIADSFSMGAKVGFFINSKYFVGGDYMQAGPFEFGPLAGDQSMSASFLGAGIGADYKVIRFWLGYYFDTTYTIAQSNADYIGTSIKGSFGLVASRKFRASLEIVTTELTELRYQGQPVVSSSSLADFNFVLTMVTLSVPIDIK